MYARVCYIQPTAKKIEPKEFLNDKFDPSHLLPVRAFEASRTSPRALASESPMVNQMQANQ